MSWPTTARLARPKRMALQLTAVPRPYVPEKYRLPEQARAKPSGQRPGALSDDSTSFLRGLRWLEAHVQPDGGAGPAGSQLDEVAHLVDQEQALASALRVAPDAPGEWVGDLSLVM